MMLIVIVISVLVLILSILIQKRAHIPLHLSNHHTSVIKNLIPKDIGSELLDLMKEFSSFPSNVDQSRAQGFAPKYEDIG
jgi:hypothetical protein